MNETKENEEILLRDGAIKKNFDYKWVIIVCCFLMIMITLGFCSSTKSLYLDVVCDNLGIDRSAFSLNDTCRFVANAIVNLFFGALVHKFGTKKLMLGGVVALAGAEVLYATATNVWMFYLGGTLLGIGFSWTGTTMIGCVVNKWCRENRGTIMGAVLAANGVGGAIAIQILSPIIEAGGKQYRNAYMISAFAVLAVGVLILIFMREAPKNYDASTPVHTKKKGRGEPWVGVEFSRAKMMPYFYVALVCIFLTGFCLQGTGGIAKAHMKDVGIDPVYIASVLSFSSLTLACFKFLTGFVYDKLGLRFTSTMCSTTAAIVTFMLAFLNNSPIGMVMALVYSIFKSLALPLETIMLPIYASDLFGERSYEKVLGIFVSVNVTGYALGAPALNLCYDIFGTYKPMLIVCAVVMAMVTLILQFVISKAHKVRAEVTGSSEKQ